MSLVDSGWTTGQGPQVTSLRTLLGTHLVGRGASRKLEREMSSVGRAKLEKYILELPRWKKRSSEALLMSHASNVTERLTKMSTSKVAFILEKCQMDNTYC